MNLRGFTYVELAVALMIMVILVGAACAFSEALAKSKKLDSQKAEEKVQYKPAY
jgi:prepilin-type N-terminal cleavage/methylation domain-containing protein